MSITAFCEFSTPSGKISKLRVVSGTQKLHFMAEVVILRTPIFAIGIRSEGSITDFF